MSKKGILSSKEQWRRFIKDGASISKDAAKTYLREVFNIESDSEVLIEMVLVRLELVRQLKEQEDLIYSLECEYNKTLGNKSFCGLFTQKFSESGEKIPWTMRELNEKANKQQKHPFSFTSVTSDCNEYSTCTLDEVSKKIRSEDAVFCIEKSNYLNEM